MTIRSDDLRELVEAGVIDRETAGRIADHLGADAPSEGSRFDLGRTAYYLGALVVMSALGWFLNEAWIRYGGFALAGLTGLYGLGFLAASEWLRDRETLRESRVPAGLLLTLAVWTVPLVVFGVQRGLGFWPSGPSSSPADYPGLVQANWFTMEGALLMASALALRYRPFSFLVFPAAAAGWFLSMDLMELAMGLGPGMSEAGQEAARFEVRRLTTLLYGGVLLGAGYLTDRRTSEDHAFWLYLFGALAVWGAVTVEGVGGVGYLALSLAFLGAALLVERKTFMVFGGIGLFLYLGRLTFEVFQDSLLFPLVLTAAGVAVMAGGYLYRKHHRAITRAVERRIPRPLREALPRNR